MRDYFYRIEGFEPHGSSFAAHSFSVYLDGGFAKRAFETKLPEQGRKNLDLMGREILRSLFGKDRMLRPPYNLVDDTCLLHFVQVPGDACDLGIDGFVLSNLKERQDWDRVEYSPHNVDSHTQAYALASLFLKWAHLVEALVNPAK
jgi:hypothetical protein